MQVLGRVRAFGAVAAKALYMQGSWYLWRLCWAARKCAWISPRKRCSKACRLALTRGDRIGIVGRNGDGKSTLLSVMAGMLEPDEGRVLRNGAVRVGVLGQFDKLNDDNTVERAVVGDIPEYEWAGDARIRDIIAGLASDIPWDAKVGTLSGGQRRRVDLARLLIGDWDVLALDEPTNHLDVRAITWLANHLKNRWRAPVRAHCWWSRTTAGSWTRSAPACGRSTTAWSTRSRAASRPTSCSAWSATVWRRWPSRSVRTTCARELAWLARGPEGSRHQAQVSRGRRSRAHRRRTACT